MKLGMIKLLKLGEVGKERLKRISLLLVGGGVILAGLKLLVPKKVVSFENIPVSQEEIVDFGKGVLDKALSILGKKTEKEDEEGLPAGRQGQEDQGEVGQVAGVTEQVIVEPQRVVEKIVEEKTKEIIQMIEELPEKQAEKLKKQIMKEVCEEVCKVE